MTPEIREEIERIRLIHAEAAEWLDENEERINGSGNFSGEHENCLGKFFMWGRTGPGKEYWKIIHRELKKLKGGEPYKVLNGTGKSPKTSTLEKEKEMNKEVIKMYPKDTEAADMVDRHFPGMTTKERVLFEGKEGRLLEEAKELEGAAIKVE